MGSKRSFTGSWANAPDPIDEGQIVQIENSDIVVCGAGISGVACALRAAQIGASVVVLEKSGNWSGRGGNIGVPNSSFMKENGYENDLEEIAREWIKRCCNRCDEEILWRYLNNGARVMDWLVDIVTAPEYGARAALQGGFYRGETYLEVVGSHRFFDGPMAKKGARPGGADAVFAMYSESLKLGVRYYFNTPALQLCKEDGRVTAVFAQTDSGIMRANAAKGVVLATGDIGGNEEMCEELSPIANKTAAKLYTPKGGNEGDGHRMGYWVGGDFEDDPFPCILHPQAFHFSNYCFLFVGPDGKRFMNEDSFVQGKSIAVIRKGFTYAWAIADSDWATKVPQTLPYGGGLFWGHDCEMGDSGFDIEHEKGSFERGLNRGVVVKADTPEELAEKMGVPVDEFVKTFDKYAKITAEGKDDEFGKRKELLLPLDKPPYYAMKFGPALLGVAGGLRVNTKMNVLDEDRTPIEGLYAVGNAAGGMYGVDYPILIAGNRHGSALTLGYLVGEELGESSSF